MVKVNVSTDLELDALADLVVHQCRHEDVAAFIKQLDQNVADVDFTRALRDYFVGEVQDEENAQALAELVEPQCDGSCDERYGCSLPGCRVLTGLLKSSLAAPARALGSRRVGE